MASSCQLGNANDYWSYCPSQAAASVFAVLFGLTTAVHVVQAFYYRKRFSWVIILGGAGETAGLVCRALSVHWQLNTSLYEAQFILILVTPLLLNAFDYMILGRMVNFLMPDRKLLGIKAKRVALYFVILDVISFLIQLGGAALTVSNNAATDKTGLNIYTAGVGLQQAFILCFLYLAVSFNKKLSVVAVDPDRAANARKLMVFVYASLTLISFRIVFRIIEFSGGHVTTVIEDNEWFAYVFDSGPMFLALLLFNVRHPGAFLQGPGSEFEKQTWKQRWARRRQRKTTGALEVRVDSEEAIMTEDKVPASMAAEATEQR